MRFCEKMLTVHINTINEILHAKFGKNRTVRFRSARGRTYIHTDGRDTPSMPQGHLPIGAALKIKT